MFQTSSALFLKHLVKKIEKPFVETILCLSFTDFQMQTFPTDYVLLGPCLKNTSCIIQF